MVDDIDLITEMLDGWDNFIAKAKEELGERMVRAVHNTFLNQGSGDVMSESGESTPAWKPLAPLTIALKKSSRILIDTLQLFRTIGFKIEDCYYTMEKNVLKVGWFEDSGSYNTGDRKLSTPHLASIHEYGMTGVRFIAPDGSMMGGDPIEGTKYGVVEIPERSMLRKTADAIAPLLGDIMDKFFIEYIGNLYMS